MNTAQLWLRAQPFPRKFWLLCLNTKQGAHVTSLRDGTPKTRERLFLGHPCATPRQELPGFLCVLTTFPGSSVFRSVAALAQRSRPAKGSVISPIFDTRGKHQKLQNFPPFTARACQIWIKRITQRGGWTPARSVGTNKTHQAISLLTKTAWGQRWWHL